MTATSTSQLAGLIELFFRRRLAAQKQASPSTVVTYRDALRLLLVFASDRSGKTPSALSVEDLDRDVVLAFLDYLENERGNTVRSRNARLGAIRSLFRHISYCDPAAVGVAQRILSIPTKRTTTRVVGFLRKEELNAVLAAPDRSKLQGRRDHALLLFLGRTGARVSEAISVNAKDLRLDSPWQVLLRGKGRKERIVPLAEDTADVLKAICRERNVPLNTEVPVFVNSRGKRLTRFGVTHILERAVRKASVSCPSLGTRSISPHTMRHTVAMHLLQAGVDLATIRSWLGHVSVVTTHHYIEADIEMKRRAIEQCDVQEAKPIRYQATDELLAFLDCL